VLLGSRETWRWKQEEFQNMHPTADQLAQQIEQTAREAFGDGKLGELLTNGQWKALATPTIKKTFADLGRQLGFRVAASGIPDADQGWLYDLVWFVPQAPFTTRVTLTLESALA